MGFRESSWLLGFSERRVGTWASESEVIWAVELGAFWAEKWNDVYEVKKKNHEPSCELSERRASSEL